ncbi:tautomerase family protein [Salinisphaera aquimarina]|uniref:Tautomerase family protein n=1 Tax=Salinisphaera aquimarina TaxID=2094031 RepID=A0ABV7ETT5_9GAMM
MPLVRIDLRRGKSVSYREEVTRLIYDALTEAGVPEDDRFQIVNEHNADNFYYSPKYLGIERTDDLIIIQITWNEGRSLDQKKALYKCIADRLTNGVGIRSEDVFINLVEVKKENWSFGNGEAQYAK